MTNPPRFATLVGFAQARFATNHRSSIERREPIVPRAALPDEVYRLSTATSGSAPAVRVVQLAMLAIAVATIGPTGSVSQSISDEISAYHSADATDSQTQVISAARHEWVSFLDSVAASDHLAANVGGALRAFWFAAEASVPNLAPPQAGPLPDGGMQVVWRDSRGALIADFCADEEGYWVYIPPSGDVEEGTIDPRSLKPRLSALLRGFAQS